MPLDYIEFSKKIKQKYPQYKNIDDLTLAKKMVEKYPQYKNEVTFTTPKKKEPTVSPSKQDQKLTSSATQPKTNLKPSVSSSSTSPKTDGKPDGLYQFPGNNKAVYKKQGGEWYVDPTGGRKFTKLYKGDVKARVNLLENKATKVYEESFDFKFEEKPKQAPIVDKKETPTQKKEKAEQQKLFTESFQALDKNDPIVLERKRVENLALNASKYVYKTEEEAVEDLKKKFSGDDDIFDFEETGVGDMLKVTNKKTGKSITVDLDGSENEQEILKSFIQSNLEFKEYNNLIEQRDVLISNLKNTVGTEEIETRKLISELDSKIKEQEFYRKGYALSNGSAMSTAMFGDIKQKDVSKNFENNVSRAIANNVVIKEEANQIKEYEDKLKNDYASGKITKEQYDTSINNEAFVLRKEELNKRYKEVSEDVYNALEDRDLMEKIAMESAASKSERGDAASNLMANFLYGFTSTTRFLSDISKYGDTPVYDSKGNRVYDTDVLSKEDFQEILPGVITEEYMSSKERSDLEKAMVGIAESLGAAASLPVGGFATNAVKSEVAKRTGVEIMKSMAKRALLTPEQIGLFASSYMNFKDQINSDPETATIDEADKVLMSGAYAYVSSKLESLGMSKWFSKGPSGTKITSWIAKNAFKDLPKDAAQELIDKRINDSFKMLLTKGAISLTAKGNVEGVTEAFQELADVGVKQVYDVLSGEDVFKNPSFGDLVSQMSESYKLGLLGGTVMSSTSQALSTAREVRTSKQIRAIENIAKDPVIKKLFEDDIKSKILSGDMTIEQAKAEMNELNESLSIIDKIPGNVAEKAESFKLISEKEKLQSEIQGKDANLVKPQIDRIAEIDNQLKKIGENAAKESKQPVEEVTAEGGGVQYQGTQEGQPEVGQGKGTVGETTQPETDLGNRPVEGRSIQEVGEKVKEEVKTYIAELASNQRIGEDVDSVMSKMNNAEYISDSEIDSTIETIFNEVESIKNNEEYSEETKKSLSDKLMNIAEQLDNYEFRTKTETVAVTQRGTAPGIGKTETIKVRAEEFFDGQKAEVNGLQATFTSKNGRVEAVTDNGDVVVLDTPTMKINEGDFEFDDNGNLTAVTVTDRFGTTAKFTGDVAMDLAIKQRENEIGTVEQADFETVYKEVETNYVKQKPTAVESVVEEKATTDTAQVETAKEAPITSEDLTQKRNEIINSETKKLQDIISQSKDGDYKTLTQKRLKQLQEDPIMYFKSEMGFAKYVGDNAKYEYNKSRYEELLNYSNDTEITQEIKEVRKKQAEKLEKDKRTAEAIQEAQKELAAILEQHTTAPVEQPTVKAKSLDDEVNELEEFLGKKTPKFQKGEQGVVDFNDVDNVTEEINQMPEDSANFDVPSNLSTKKKINIKSLIERFSEKLKSIKNGGVIKDISKFNGIPFIFTISDQLSSGKLKNAFTGNTIDVNGGLGFSLTDGNENNAWANTTSSEAEKTLSRAKEVYRKNKDLFDRLWAEGVLPNGHVPMAVVKMGQESIMTNEALFRFASDTIKKKFSKADRTNSLNGLIEDIIDFEIDSENRRRKKSDKKLMSNEEIDSMSKSVMSSDNVINFIKENNFKTIDELLDNINKLTPISSRAKISKILFTGNVDNKTNPEVGKITKKSALALVGNKDKSFRKYIHINTINELIREEATKDIPKNHIIAIVGVDVINGKVTSSKNGEVTHRNYPYGIKGKLIGVLENPVNVADVFAEAYARVFVMNKPNKSGVFPSAKTTVDQAVASSGAIASMKTLRGAKLSSKITDLQKLLAKMRIAFPSVSVFETQEEFNKAIQNPNVNKFIKKGDVVYGFTIDGKIYLNPEKANSNTAIHEFSHVWMGFLRENNPELLRKGFSLLEGTDILRKKIKEFGDTDLAREEAMADIIASRGEVIIEASKKSKFKNWLNAVFRYIKSNFKAFDKLTPEEFQNLSLNEFVDGSLSVLIGGKEITEKDIKSIQVMFSKVNKIDEIISIARDNGFSDAAIKKYLEKSGFEQKDINAAMKQRKAPSTAKILGKPAPKKVTVNEATALKDQLKLEARAAREADMDLKRKQRSLVAYINGLKRQGLISVSQAVSIAKRIVMTNVNNPVMVSRMLDYAERVFKDAEYRNKLSKANSSRKRIKASIKNSSLQGTVVSVAKEFSNIDPRLIDDIDVYNSYADVVLDAVGRKSLPDTRTAMNFSAILDYTDRAKAEMDSRLNQEIKDIDDSIEKQMAETPDTELMTMSEIKDLIKSLKSTEEVDVSQAKKELIARYLSRFSELYNPIVEQEMKDQNTPQKQRELMSKLMDIDLQEVDLREAVKIIDAIQNFITNGITDNVESIVESYQGSKNAKEVASKNIPTSKARLKLITKVWQEKMMSLPLLAEWIFKTPKRAVYVLEKMGINDFVNGVSKATKQWTRTIDTYYSEFKNKKANGKNFMDAENIYERNMYADLKRTVAKDEKAQKEELDKKIKLLNKSVEVLRNMGDDTDKKKADLYEKLIKKLGLNEEGVTIESIESKVDKVNIDAVNWWINAWSGVYSELSDVSKNVYNTVLEKDLYYTPMKFSTLLSGVSEKVQQESERMGGGSFSAAMNYVYDKKSGSLMPSTKPADMETGRYVDLEFDMNNSRAFKAALVDINTAASTRRIKSFLKSKSFLEIIPDKTERDLFESRVAGYIVASRGNTTPTDEKALGDIERSLRVWASLGATRALGGLTQPFKQTIPVLTNTLLNVGRNFSLISSKAEWKWIDEIGMPISNRGQESLAAFESAEKKLENNMMTSAYGKTMKSIENINSRWLKWMLSKPDVYAARSSFIAYYKQALRAKGKSAKIDFNNPANVDQEALNYAQHMIDKQQNVSDIEQMGTLFSGKSPVMKIVKNVLFPFMSFAINQKSRIVTDMRRFSAKGVSVQDRLGAAKSLFATSSEMVVFHTMSYLIGQYFVRGLASAFGGGEEDEEEDKKYRKRRLGYTISSAARDVLSPIPLTDPAVDMLADWFLSSAKIGATDADAKEALNAFNQMRELKGKDPYTGEKATEWLNKYIEDNRVSIKTFDDQIAGGMYSITISQFKDLYDSYRLAFEGEYDVKGFGDKPLTKYVDKETQEELKTLFYWNLGQKIVGFPSEGAAIIRRMESTLKKKGGLTENQKATEDELTKKLNKSKLNDFEMTLVKNIKATESQTSAERVSKELNFVKEYIKSPNSKQIEELIKVYEKNKAIMYDDVMRIKSMK